MLSKFDFGLGNIEREQQWQSYNYRVKGLEKNKKTFPCCVSTLYIFYNIICIAGPQANCYEIHE